LGCASRSSFVSTFVKPIRGDGSRPTMSMWSQARYPRLTDVSNPFEVVFRPRTLHQQQMRLGYLLVLPSLGVLCFTVFYPIAQTVIYSLYTNRLNVPTLGTPFVGLGNYATLLSQAPFW